MTSIKHTKIAIFVIAAAVLASSALVISPARMAYAQDNATATMDTDGIIKSLKAKHKALSALGEDGDRELLSKIKDMDAKGSNGSDFLKEFKKRMISSLVMFSKDFLVFFAKERRHKTIDFS